VYMTEKEGRRLLPHTGRTVALRSVSKRIMGTGENVIARKGKKTNERIVVTAHIDAKKGTPGAIDNAVGVIILLLLSKLLEDYEGDRLIEIVALNGEDYYAVPGQMRYLRENQGRFHEILLNINIDGAGYKEGKSAFSFYDLPEEIKSKTTEVLQKFDGIIEGVPWFQGDHSIFIQNGCPAIAVSSEWFTSNIDSQEITHTPKDHAGIVDCQKVVEIAEALYMLVRH
jgi:aminopeptidase YwaD